MSQSLPVMTREAAEKTQRSIFVGNIPYEATEEKLIELFSKAGPVIGFRLVYDRESGKPKGYGFCEYNNPAIASSALRNLQNIEFNGRPLRIGPAAGEQNSAELALSNPAVGPPLESPYGDAVDPQAAPEAISRAVASLPPEQMYELMKQMKLCIQNNPNEARNMLLQNPQLAYALLQAQIVMKIVDPKVAIAMLNRSHDQIPPAMPDECEVQAQKQPAPVSLTSAYPGATATGGVVTGAAAAVPTVPKHDSFPGQMLAPSSGYPQPQPVSMPSGPVGQAVPFPGEVPTSVNPGAPNFFQPAATNIGPPATAATQPPPAGHFAPHSMAHCPPGQPRPPYSDYPSGGILSQSMPPPPPPIVSSQINFPPYGSVPPTPVQAPPPQTTRMRPPQQITPAVAAAAAASMGADSLLAGQGEQEKVALIMQVLQLSAEQLALLPDDQRRSICILKEQLGKTGAI